MDGAGAQGDKMAAHDRVKLPITADHPSEPEATAVPLCVDLDGTLLKTDTLLEAVLQLLRRSLFHGLQLLAWLFRGRAGLKSEVARRVDLDVARLPVNEEFLGWLRSEKAQGRRLVLCTAATESFAVSIASHFGLFDDVLASDSRRNLSGRHKGSASPRSTGRPLRLCRQRAA